ncbi:MAG: TerC family protein [Acidobacteriota bacterium]|nr:TerC family protein [Acidobacteriota bacterium]MDH3522676.1 TerC family protein [Acidobacteriota bacterium]
MFDWIADPAAWVALATLTALELVLGIDNIIFISILAGKLPAGERGRARSLGLLGAMLTRILLLFSLAWVIGLTEPLFSILGRAIAGRDLILVVGGLFLLAKSTHEIHQKLEGTEHEISVKPRAAFGAVITQIMLLDIVFSLDSVITAVGMVRQIPIMVIAVVVSVGFMLWFAKPLGEFVERHPTVKMLALSFLLLIGMALVADGVGHHIPKGYIYFAMGFSVFVEMLNLRLRKARRPVELRERFEKR